MSARGLLNRGAAAACPREAEVLAAHRPGADRPPAAVAAHLAECAGCRRVARLSGALAVLAAEGPGVPLPDPHHVLWRARVLERFAERRAAEERAARPLRWALAAGLLVVALLGTLAGTTLIVHGLPAADSWLTLASGGSLAGALRLLMWGGVGLLAAALALAARLVFQEG